MAIYIYRVCRGGRERRRKREGGRERGRRGRGERRNNAARLTRGWVVGKYRFTGTPLASHRNCKYTVNITSL